MIKYIYYEDQFEVLKALFTSFKCSNRGFDKKIKNELILCLNENGQGIVCSFNIYEDMAIMKVLSESFSGINLSEIGHLNEGITELEKDISISKLEIFIEDILDYMSITLSGNSDKKLFRGQSNKEWNLEPSITRGKKMQNKEATMYLEIQQANHKEFIDDDFINNACNMQHYGIPTRLLDWTENALHALYFACVSESWIGAPGKIYYIKSPEFININSKENEIIEHFLRYKYLNCEKVKESIINHLKKMVSSDSKRYTFFKTKYYNERIKSQQGCFSVYFEQTEEEATIIRELLLDELKNDYLNFDLHKGRIEREVLNSISDKITEVVKSKKFDSYYIRGAIDYINSLLELDNHNQAKLAEELIEWLKKLSKVIEKKHCMDDIVSHENQLQIIVKPEIKETLIKQLESMGINSRTVYPDIQGLASYLKEHY